MNEAWVYRRGKGVYQAQSIKQNVWNGFTSPRKAVNIKTTCYQEKIKSLLRDKEFCWVWWQMLVIPAT